MSKERLTSRRVNGIKSGYWTAANKEEVVQRLGELEDAAESGMKDAAASNWISTADALPPVGVKVIIARVFEVGQPLRVETGTRDINDWWRVYGTNVKRVSYWMPLPLPPEDGTR